MSGKRLAEVQLTKDNYDLSDDDDEGQSLTTPLPFADEERLKTRKILVAKRRFADEGDKKATKSIFADFKGFGANSNGTSQPFSFVNTAAPSSGFKLNTNNESSKPTFSLFASNSTNGTSSKPILTTTITEVTVDNQNKNEEQAEDGETTFKTNVKALNDKYYSHITKFMNESKLYNFTIVCEEYIKHFEQLEKTKLKNSAEGSKTDTESLEKPKSTIASTNPSLAATPMFSFQIPPTFGTSKVSGFTFNPNNLPKPATSPVKPAEEGQNDGESEEPPKVESIEHQEENAVYKIKCKLYYQKDGAFIDKGAGFLYIKIAPDAASKPQLLVRTDTNTGNILLNIALVSSLPITKVEKKGVMITCIANPPIEMKKPNKDGGDDQEKDKKTTTFLIRVKHTEVGSLFEALNKHKA